MGKKNVIIAAGGTGGHLFPAIVVAQEFINHGHKILFVGSKLSQNCFFNQTGYLFSDIATATFSFRKPLSLLVKGATLAKGVTQSILLIKNFCPDLVVGFGSYHTLPILTAAVLKKVPLFLHEQNLIPGKVNRFFSRFALLCGVTFPDSGNYLKGQWKQSLYPLRYNFSLNLQAEAEKYFSLKPKHLTFLILGGSLGAKSLNILSIEALLCAKPFLPPFQVIHLAGNERDIEKIQKKWEYVGIEAKVKPFEARMDLAWSAANCAIARAGGGSISEQIHSVTPGVLIPYPFAAENHQEKNAYFFSEKIRGGIVFDERKQGKKELASAIVEVVKNLDSYKRNLENHLQKTKLPTFYEFIQRYL